MKEHLHFLRSFLKNPLAVGAISPSSPELALKMIEGLKPDENNIIVEIGCGTGAITKFIQDLVKNEHSYLGIELEKTFVEDLQRSFPNLDFICGDACQTEEILACQNLGKVSYIISGVPFVVLPPKVYEGILDEVDKLMEKGCLFRTFQYAHGYNLPPAKKFRLRMEKKYGNVERSELILKNIPPAYTLTWKTF